MDHGDMRMQGGSAPDDARDPDAYSDDLVRGVGVYAVPGVPALSLADEQRFGALLVERLERSHARAGDNATAYDLQGWLGRDFDKAVLKAEGEVADGKLHDARTELLWGHAVTPYWDTQLGIRYDTGTGPDRGWLAFGVQGLAPYWFEVEATAYVGNGGRTALRLAASYDLLLTQKLILQPRGEMQFYGKNDPARDIGSDLSNATLGLRLRYELSRQFAPYLGIERSDSFGQTSDLVREAGERARQTRWVAGVRFWF
nr:copper resistance protein B [Pseudomonas citronellolis]